MKPTTLQIKASRLLALDSRRKAHHRALSSLHASPLPDLTESHYEAAFLMRRAHETRGLAMWRKLKRLESEARQQTVSQNNGTGLAPGYFQAFCDRITADVAKVFGGTLPDGFSINTDGRGHALKLNCDKTVIPDSLPRDMGGDGILAADISL